MLWCKHNQGGEIEGAFVMGSVLTSTMHSSFRHCSIGSYNQLLADTGPLVALSCNWISHSQQSLVDFSGTTSYSKKNYMGIEFETDDKLQVLFWTQLCLQISIYLQNTPILVSPVAKKKKKVHPLSLTFECEGVSHVELATETLS